MDIELASSLGIAEVGPVCGLIASTIKSWFFDKGFQQDWAHTVAGFPIVRELSCGHTEDGGRQVFTADPRQDEETCVVDHEVKTFAALAGFPTYVAVAGFDGPGGGTKADQRDDALIGSDEVA